MKALIAAAVIVALALSPSIGECLEAHEQEHPKRWALWVWVALVVILAILFGETMMRAS